MQGSLFDNGSSSIYKAFNMHDGLGYCGMVKERPVVDRFCEHLGHLQGLPSDMDATK